MNLSHLGDAFDHWKGTVITATALWLCLANIGLAEPAPSIAWNVTYDNGGH